MVGVHEGLPQRTHQFPLIFTNLEEWLTRMDFWHNDTIDVGLSFIQLTTSAFSEIVASLCACIPRHQEEEIHDRIGTVHFVKRYSLSSCTDPLWIIFLAVAILQDMPTNMSTKFVQNPVFKS
jgi:hypothetical protein